MSAKQRIKQLEKANPAKTGLNVAMLKPSEIAKRVRAILAASPALVSEDIMQRLESLEQANPCPTKQE